MFTVIVTEKGGDQRRLDFDKPEVTIGRVQGNDIILPKGNVSKRHSRIVFKDGKFIIVDLKSTNGTYVNGRKITSPLVIKETDKVYIGDFILTIEEGTGGGAAEAMPSLSPGLDVPDEPLPPPEPARVAMAPPPAAPVTAPPPPPRKTAPPPPVAAAPPPVVRRTRPAVSSEEAPDLDQAVDELADELRPSPARPTAPRPVAKPPAGLVSAPPPAPRSVPRPTPSALPPSSSRSGGLVAAAPAPESPPSTAPPRAEAPAPRLVGAGAPAVRAPAPTPPPPVAATPGPVVREREVAPPKEVSDPQRAKVLELQRVIHERLAGQLDLDRLPLERLADEALWQRAEGAIVDLVEQMDADGAIPEFVDRDALIKDALNETLGLGPLEDFLVDDDISFVLVNRPDRILIERAGQMALSDKGFSSDKALRKVIERLVAPAGVRLEEAGPLLDLRLPDGVRLTCALPPLAVRGACFALRKLRPSLLALDDLVRAGSLSTHMADFLATCVSARRNILVCGAPNSGKTALLAALVGLVPASERVVSVEEVAELELARDNWISLETRPPGLDGRGGVGMVDILRAALRMRPDRLVVGDVRGAEAFELCSALASAHDGAVIGVGGDGARAALARLESMARLAAAEASARGLRELVAHAFHIVVQMTRFADGLRRVSAIYEVTGTDEDGCALRELFAFQPQGLGGDGAVRGRFAGAGVIPKFYEQLEARGLPADPSVFR